jgi:archaellum component FlaC
MASRRNRDVVVERVAPPATNGPAIVEEAVVVAVEAEPVPPQEPKKPAPRKGRNRKPPAGKLVVDEVQPSPAIEPPAPPATHEPSRLPPVGTLLADVNEALRQVMQRCADVSQHLQAVQAELQEAAGQGATLREHSQTLTRSLREATREAAEVSERAKAAKQELLETEGAVGELRRSLEEARRDITQPIRDARSQVLELREDCQDLQRQVREVHSQIEALRPPVTPVMALPASETPPLSVVADVPPPLPGALAPSPVVEATPEAKLHLGITVDSAAMIVEVLPETPAHRAGLLLGDVVLGVDDRTVSSSKTLCDALDHVEPAREVLLTVARGGDTEKIKATLAESRPHEEVPVAVGHEDHS